MHRNTNPAFTLLISLLIVFLLTGCAQPTISITPAVIPAIQSPTEVIDAPAALETTLPAIDVQMLQNLDYRLETVAESLRGSDGLVHLTDGKFEQALPDSAATVQVNYLDSVIGDLNDDGLDDAVVLLAVDTGGTGTFMHLAAVLNQQGQLHQAASTLLGDRIKVNSMQIQDSTILLAMVVHSATDPLCCPTLEKQDKYILLGDRLVTQ